MRKLLVGLLVVLVACLPTPSGNKPVDPPELKRYTLGEGIVLYLETSGNAQWAQVSTESLKEIEILQGACEFVKDAAGKVVGKNKAKCNLAATTFKSNDLAFCRSFRLEMTEVGECSMARAFALRIDSKTDTWLLY